MLAQRPKYGNNLTVAAYFPELTNKVREYQSQFEAVYDHEGDIRLTALRPECAHVTLAFIRVDDTYYKSRLIAEAIQAELFKHLAKLRKPLELGFQNTYTTRYGNHRIVLDNTDLATIQDLLSLTKSIVQIILRVLSSEEFGRNVWFDGSTFNPHLTLYTKLPNPDQFCRTKMPSELKYFNFGVGTLDHIYKDYNGVFKQWKMPVVATPSAEN